MAAPHTEGNNGVTTTAVTTINNNHNHAGYASHPDSGDSSPRSRGTDCDNSSSAAVWDDAPPPLPPQSLSHRHPGHPPSHHPVQRVKLLCSYGGRIQPRPHDHQLAYAGGDTKIVAVDRSVRYPQLLARLAALVPAGTAAGDVCFKYQLPGEDLDALISVTNDEDVEHLMAEYDRLQRSAAKPPRLRLFLFPLGNAAGGFLSSDSTASDRQWFVDALNSVPAPPAPSTESFLPPGTRPPGSGIGNPDFLFGLENGFGTVPSPLTIHDPTPEDKVSAEASPTDDATHATAGSDSTKEDSWIGGGEPPSTHQLEIQRQIQELQTLHIASQKEASGAAYQQQHWQPEDDDEEILSRAYPAKSYQPPKVQELQEKSTTMPQIPLAYMPDKTLAGGGVYSSMARLEQPVYLIPSVPPPAHQSIYPGTVLLALAGQAGQSFFAPSKQSVAPGTMLHQSAYMVAPPPPPQPSAKTVGAHAKQGLVDASGVVNTVAPQLLSAYNSAATPLYLVRPAPGTGGGSVMPAYQTQTATSGDTVRSGATAPPPPPPSQLATPASAAVTAVTTAQLLNPEGMIAAKPLPAS